MKRAARTSSRRPSAKPGRNKGMSQTSARGRSSPVVLVDRGRFTQFGKRSTVGILGLATSLHIFSLAAAEPHKIREVYMTALDRRTLMATTVASIATPATLGAKECRTMDWITMSL